MCYSELKSLSQKLPIFISCESHLFPRDFILHHVNNMVEKGVMNLTDEWIYFHSVNIDDSQESILCLFLGVYMLSWFSFVDDTDPMSLQSVSLWASHLQVYFLVSLLEWRLHVNRSVANWTKFPNTLSADFKKVNKTDLPYLSRFSAHGRIRNPVNYQMRPTLSPFTLRIQIALICVPAPEVTSPPPLGSLQQCPNTNWWKKCELWRKGWMNIFT